MLLGDVLNQLARLELKNLAIVEAGKIVDDSRANVIQAVNQALEDLYTRFNFREKTLLIELQDGLVEYKMLRRYAYSQAENYPTEPHFIMDSPEVPYTGDLIRITWVWDASGQPIPLNDVNNHYSVFTPHPDTLLVHNPIQDDVLSIVYQSLPDVISEDALDTLDFELPRTMGSALRAYAASKLFESMGTQETITKSQLLLQAYENYCAQAQFGDTLNTGVTSTSKKFHQRGFV